MTETHDIKKLRELTADELQLRAAELLREMFNLRLKRAGSELTQPHLIRAKKREYARILTVANERRRAAAAKKA